MTTAENDNRDFAEDFADLFESPGPEERLTLLAEALREDPFATTREGDGENYFGVASLTRYERASAAYVAACHSPEQDDDQQEILRLLAAYWLKKSRAFWLE